MNVVSRSLKILLFLAYLALVAWLCFGNFKPSPDIPRSVWGIPIDKCIHFLMFLPFPILGTLAFDFRSWWRALAVSMLMANVVAFLFERLQSVLTSHRITDAKDLNANLLGITLGLLIAIVIGLICKKK
ncbi:MAG: VanZ family protein [Bacteroidales bacterium]|nr:VanZ family protein [Bacteroidales bacterium]